MHTRFAHWAACTLVLVLAGCGQKTEAPAACVDSDPGCGVACNASHPCGAGLHCGEDGLCAKACTEAKGCPSNQHCSASGECVAGAPPQPVMMMTDNTPKGGSGHVDNPGDVLDAAVSMPMDAGSTKPSDCSRADVSATRVIPTVVLVIDQSDSMSDPFGSSTRWDTLRDFLLKPDGLIASLESQVSFGLAMYSAMPPPQGGTLECPLVTSVSPMVKNYAAIKDTYTKAKPIKDTPTGDAIDKIVADLPKPAPDQDNGPVVLVLATDGEPDRCEELNPQNGQAEAVAAVTHAFEKGIRTFIISVGDEISTKHQQDMANAGVGHKMGEPDAPYWNSDNDATLRDALTQIIGAQVSCEVTLKGEVQSGDACDGTVTLGGTPLVCKDKNGWELVDSKHIRLLGDACNNFKNQKAAVVHASFPCSVQVVF